MKHLGDITKMTPFCTDPVDCVTFGSPCQDLSIAGKLAGLAGERSGLFMEAVRVIKDMRLNTFGAYPTFAVWENVPGAFSSNKGEDFHAVLEELAHIVEPEVSIPRPENGKWAKAGFVSGNGWSLAWRTFDAQFWGVPQRRRRIALVVDFGGQRAGEILFERTSLRGDSEPSIPAWKGVARNPAHGPAGHDRVAEGATSYTLKVRSGCEGSGKGPLVQTHEQPIVFENHRQDARYTKQGDTSPTCTAHWGTGGNNMPLVAFAQKQRDEVRDLHGVDGALAEQTGMKQKTYIAQSALTPWDNQARRVYSEEGAFPALSAREHVGQNQQAVLHKTPLRWIVRRLTPTECERLQGFPDGWTDIGEWYDSATEQGYWTDTKGKRHKTADSPRYKALGNSIALPQWWWITCKMARYLPEKATLGSLFDGIGGFPLVWETKHGKGTAVWASEIEEFPIAVTKMRFGEEVQ